MENDSSENLAAKSGVDPSRCVELAKHVKLCCPHLELSGLMTIGMPDYSSTPENFKVIFLYFLHAGRRDNVNEKEFVLQIL